MRGKRTRWMRRWLLSLPSEVRLVSGRGCGGVLKRMSMRQAQVLRTWETWSDIVSLESSITPRTLSVVTLRLRRYLWCSGSCSRDNQLFSLGRMNFHIIVFGPFLDAIKFVDKSSYARRTYQQIGIICKFGHDILFMPRVEVRCRHHI